MDELTNEYIADVLEKTDEIEECIMNLENKDGDSDAQIRKIKLIVHSIKGSAGGFGFETGSFICHKLEDFLESSNLKDIDEKITNTLFKFKDSLVNYFKSGKTEDSFENEISHNIQSLTLDENSLGISALVIEKSNAVNNLIRKTLGELGIQVTIAKDTYDALGILLRTKFNFLLTAQDMPKFSGLHLINIISMIRPQNDTHCYLMTSNTHIKDAHNFHVIHKNDHLMDDIRKYFEKDLKSMLKKFGHQEETASTKHLQIKKIVHIDDDIFTQKLVKAGLKMARIEVIQSLDPQETVELCTQHKPDLILLDYYIGDIDGVTILKILQENSQIAKIPVMFMTGEEDEKKLQEMVRAGAAGVIKKPFKPFELKKLIEEAL